MAKISFTTGRIAEFICPNDKHQVFLWDSNTPGLGLRATHGGSKVFIFQGKLNSQTIRLTIGDIKTISIKDAREEACDLQATINKGRDPRQVKTEQTANDETARSQAKIEAMRNTITVQSVWGEYIADCENKWGVHHATDHRKVAQQGGQPQKRGTGTTTQGVLYPLLQMRMLDINASVLRDWQKQETLTRATSARQGFVLFRAFWRWCEQHKVYADLVDIKILENKKLKEEVPAPKTKKFDVLQRAHLPVWFAAVRGLSNPVISAYLQGLLLTGARREELAELKWVDVDFRWGSLWVKDKVEDEGRMIPLNPYLASLLNALPRRNKWVFSSPTSADGKLAEPRIAHNRALAIAGLSHVSIHGLRRTFASLAEWCEMPAGVVAQIMGHKPKATAEQHYINRPLELLGVWHGKYEAWILEQASIDFQQTKSTQGLRVIK